MHLTEIQYNILYTIYSLPNTLIPLAGGFIIDNFGGRESLLLFSGILIVG